MKKIMIAMPCLNSVDVNTAQCLAKLQKRVNNNPLYDADVCYIGNSLIHDARNLLMRKAINENYDWILWIDSDMVFEDDVLDRLLDTAQSNECHFVCGQFFSRRGDYKPAIFSECRIETGVKNEIKPVVHNYLDYPRDGKPFEVEACGFAGTLTSVPMLDAIFSVYGLPFTQIVGFGEDLSFCIRARGLDFKILCDTKVKFGHLSQVIIDETAFDSARANKE